jgi:hypothetical protein
MKYILKKTEITPVLVCIGILIFCSFISPPLPQNDSSQKEEIEVSYTKNENISGFKKILSVKTEHLFVTAKAEFFKKPKYLPDEKNSLGVQYPKVLWAKGKNEKERTKDFVMKHCSVAVQKDWEYGYDFAEKNGIRGPFLFAIAFSDSGCGKALTTKNNLGNVGNYGEKRTEYSSMKAGMEAIVYSLNGEYISGIEKIGHLSSGGRNEIGSKYTCRNAPSPYKCYAMSTENWNANVKRALTSMAGQEIDGNFVFRKKAHSADLAYGRE